MAEKKGKRLPGIVAAGFLVFAVPTAVLAAGGSGRTENIKSHGVIEYKGQSDTVRIDSSDLVYLAKEIDAVEKAAKWGSVQALKAIGTELGIEEENRVSDISFLILIMQSGIPRLRMRHRVRMKLYPVRKSGPMGLK